MARSSEYKSAEPLCVNSCDCQNLFGRDVGSNREKGRIDYHILFITEGSLFIKEKGIETEVPKGNIVIYRPLETQNYYVKAEIKTTSYYVHFSGTECEKILSDFRLLKRVVNIGEIPHAESLFKKMIEEYYLKRPYSAELCAGYLYTILALFARRNEWDSHYISDERIEKVLRCMAEDFGTETDISLYADMCNLSISRFIHLFKKCTGKSPKNYIMEMRVKRAAQLLENTDLPMQKVGEEVGISDQNYFSRIFKKYNGVSPLNYRKNFN